MSLSADRRTFLRATVSAAGASTALSVLGVRAYAAPPTSEWINLFDGNSLKGWHKNPQKIGHGTGGIWRVEDGTITGEQDPPGSGNGGILLTDQTFGDFELMIDMMPDWGVCSGLFLRGNDRGQCFQMMVDYHDAGNVGQIYGEGTGGFNTRTFDIDGEYDEKRLVGLVTSNNKSTTDVGLKYACEPAAWLKAWKLNDWNTARVRVEGQYPLITTWINGLKVCVFDGASASTPKYDKEGVFEKLGRGGSIAVQVHGGTGWPTGAKCRWKDIKIREI